MFSKSFTRSFGFGARASNKLLSGDIYAANVVSLLHFDGNFVDEKGVIWTPMSPAPAFVSGMYDSAGAIRVNPSIFDNPLISDTFTGSYFGSRDFCIESSVIIGSTWTADSRSRGVFGSWQSDSFAFGIRHATGGAGNGGRFSMVIGTSLVEHPTDLTKGTKYTVALTRQGNVYTLYVNGVPSDPLTKSGSLNFVNLGIGSPTGYGSSSGPLNGDIDEFRITIDTPRYTGTYTPQTGPFSN